MARGIERTVVLTRDGEEGIWLAQCRLPGHSLLDGTGEKRRDAVATVERKLIRATGGGIPIGQYRTRAFISEASNVIPLRWR